MHFFDSQQRRFIKVHYDNSTVFCQKKFHRKLCAVKEFEYYKAVEFRTIIMYLAPLLFKQYLPVNFL